MIPMADKAPCPLQVFVCLILLLPTCLSSHLRAETESTRPEGWSYAVNESTGALQSFKSSNREWLKGPSSFSIVDELTGKGLAFELKRIEKGQGAAQRTCRLEGAALSVRYHYRVHKEHLEVKFEVINRGEKDIGCYLSWKLPLHLSGKNIFITDKQNSFAFDDLDIGRKFSYPSMAFPMLTAYDGKGGVSVVRDPEDPISWQSFIVSPDGRLDLRATSLRLAPGKTVKNTYFIVPHSGDWRAALRWFRSHYRKWLAVESKLVLEQEGAFNTWRPVSDEALKDYAGQGLKWWEVHGTFPLYGKYVAEKDPYHWLAGSRLGRLKNAGRPGKDFSELGNPDQTHEQVRDFIRRLHKVGASAYMYWNQNDCWHGLAKEYPDGIAAKNSRGEPRFIPRYSINLMAVDPPNSWTHYILSQLDKIIETYPELDGIFNDQVCYYSWDYARDDGVSMVKGKPVYNNRFAYHAILEKVSARLHGKGLVLWGNGAYVVDVARFLDGIMAEGSSKGMERTRYLGILGKPVVMYSAGRSAATRELNLKRCLISGAQPNVVRVSAPKGTRLGMVKLMKAYMPYFRLLRGKQWVLADRALETPEGMEGNVFVNPRGQGIAPIVCRKKSQLDSSPESYFQTVKVRFEDDKYAGLYLMSPERPGRYKLSPQKTQEGYRADLPVHKSASVLVFESAGVHLSVHGDSMLAIPGEKHKATASVDNFSKKSISGKFIICTTSAKKERECRVEPGQSCTMEVALETTEEMMGRTIPIDLAFESKDLNLRQECAVLVRAPMTIELTGPKSLMAGEELKIRVRAFNLTKEPRRAGVSITSGQITASKFNMLVKAGEFSDREVSFQAMKPGIVSVCGDIGASRAEVTTEIIGTALRSGAKDLRNIARAWIVMQVNTSGRAAKKVLLNGTAVAELGGVWGSPWRETRLEIPPACFGAIRTANSVSILNPVKGLFVLKNPRLELLMADGVRITSRSDRRIFRTTEDTLKGIQLDFDSNRKVAVLPLLSPERMESATLSFAFGTNSDLKEDIPVYLNDERVAVIEKRKKGGYSLDMPLKTEAFSVVRWGNTVFFPDVTTPERLIITKVALKVGLEDGSVLTACKYGVMRRQRGRKDSLRIRLQLAEPAILPR